MKTTLAIRTFIAATWTAQIAGTLNVGAQTPDFRTTTPRLPGETGEARPPLFEAWAESTYTAAGDAEFRGAKSGRSDGLGLHLSARSLLPLNERWIIPFGMLSQNVFMDGISGVPIPEGIHTLRFSTGLGHRVNDRLMFAALVSPTLYKFSDLGGNDLGVSGGFTAIWNYQPTLTFMAALMFAPDSDLPVIPALGVNWAINDQFELSAMIPRPRLTYRPSETWSFHAGGEIDLVTFRTSNQLGNTIGLTQYNDALANYTEIRLGLGAGFRLNPSFTLEAAAGAAVSRELNYTRIGERVQFDPSPYVRFSFSGRF